MSVAAVFALVGGIILVGFLANLLFRLTRIPTVLLLIGAGILLGPVTGLVRSEALLDIAPVFGAIALVIILFEGGLELELEHVLRQAPRAAVLCGLVFALSWAAVTLFAIFFIGLPLLAALLLGAILAATSPAIAIPLVSGLSVRNEVKTLIKLEAALGDVLLIVAVVLLIDVHTSGATDVGSWVWGFLRSLSVAIAISSLAGVLWSRLIAWMGEEPLAYMLTLGIVFLQYFVVEELGGSAAIGVLVFGLILANMESIADRFGSGLAATTGLDLRREQFVLNQFVVRITAELSFLVRTFFFVYLGLIIDFRALTWEVGMESIAIAGLTLIARAAGLALLRRGRLALTRGERQAIMALAPRGLATAVMAFLAMRSGVEGVEPIPLYTFAVIILSNMFMTGGVVFAERRLRREARPGMRPDEEPSLVADEPLLLEEQPPVVRGPHPFSPAFRSGDTGGPTSFSEWIARGFGVRPEDREREYGILVGASYLSEPLFWMKVVLAGGLCALGLILDQSAIIIGAALVAPLARPVLSTGLALAAGDVYLLVKLAVKLLLASALVMVLSAILVDVLPFGAGTAEIAARTRPTILDFLVALMAGMAAALFASSRATRLEALPGALVGITLLPALGVAGFGLAGGVEPLATRGAALLFVANLFAAVLGAALVLLLAGVPRAATSEVVRSWKDSELSRPVVRWIFTTLRLQRVVGRTGSVRARVVVVAVFLLALLVPLQSAFNQLTREYRARQAVTESQQMFEVRGRSSLLSTTSVIGDEALHVRMHVATNQLFGAKDIATFEGSVRQSTGLPTHLELVQSVGDIGQAETLRAMLAARRAPPEATPAPSLSASARGLASQAVEAVNRLPWPKEVSVVGVTAELDTTEPPRIVVLYLAGAALDDGVRDVLARVLAERAAVEERRIELEWMPDRYGFGLTGSARTRIGEADETLLRSVGERVRRHRRLAARLQAPPGLSTEAVEQLRVRVGALMGLPDLPLGVPAPRTARRSAVVHLAVSASEPF